jgi:hypothetical protein
MAVNIDSFSNWLGGLWGGDEDQINEFNNNPGGALAQAGFGDATAIDVQQAVTRLTETNQGNTSFTQQGGGPANFAGSGVVNVPPPPPAYEAYEASGNGGGLQGAIESINHYSSVYNTTDQTYEDNDTTVINDQDTSVDNSVNQDIAAFGDVNQDFDNDVVTGDGNALGGDNSQVNSGAGAVQAGDDIEDSTIATGPVGGSVTGDVNDSIVGDGNVGIIDSDIDGAVAVGGGDAIDAENVAQGGSTIIDDTSGDVNANTGDGTQTVIDDSTISESAVGEGNTVQSNDINVSADDGSAVAFGEGSDADSGDIDSTNFGGTTQIAGDESSQLGQTDNSIDTEIDVEDSFNTDNSVDNSLEVEDSFTVDDSFDTEDSFNATDSFDVEDNSTTTTDDDLIDLA